LVPLSERLLLIEVELHSPGFWKFLGVDGILEQIRLYLQDRHERGKDKQYRESQERRGLELENKLREAELMRRRIEVAKELGASEEELRSVLQHFVLQPLNELDKYQDQGLITGVESELASGEK
ncbi:MAG TPA: hypothetical protein VH724_13510, partial [Candidatus Angelobacter sp.]|nr:hypothetical protein [Candidatus Angelobacter sp.]